MKNLFVFLVLLFVLGLQCIYSQNVNMEQLQKEVRKTSKKMAKEGWRSAPGAPSIYQQLLDEKHYQTYKDDKGNLLYSYTIADHEADSYVEAYEMALLLCKIRLVSMTYQSHRKYDGSANYNETTYISTGNNNSSLDYSGFDTIYRYKDELSSIVILQKNTVYVEIDQILAPNESVQSVTRMDLTPQLDKLFHVVNNMYKDQKNGKISALVGLVVATKDLEELCGQDSH